MKSINGNAVRKICVAAGICLLVSAIAALVVWQLGIHSSEKQAEYYVDTIRASIPNPQGAIPESRRDNSMSVLSIDGTDFVGILEIPSFGSVLPVGADWGRSSEYPCRFDGSVYDKTIKIGATSQKGQYDFYREISVGDSVLFTDAEGNRYSYSVKDIRYEDNADKSTLESKDSALTLFIKNEYSFEYIVVFCDVLN